MEILAQNGFQPFGIAGLAGEAAGKEEFGDIRHSIAILQRFHPNSKEAADVSGKTLISLAVGIDGLLAGGPGPIKHRD
jgi:hypothetical protein